MTCYNASMLMTQEALAEQLGTSERTLRRLSEVGMLRARRDWRRLKPGEGEWLISHWQMVRALREALRTEKGVKSVLIFGSVAKGTDGPDSDLDLAVDMEDDEDLMVRRALRKRLEAAVGRKIDMFSLRDLESEPSYLPSFLLNIMKDARPVVDREGWWASLSAHKRAWRARRARGLARRGR